MKLILSNDQSLYSLSLNPENPKTNNLSFEPQPLNPPRPSRNNTNENPFSFDNSGPSIVGSCKGLLCLNYPECNILWNPLTRTHFKIPDPEDDLEFQQRRNWRFHVVNGLGYDEVNDDFKVVRVYQYLGDFSGEKKFDTKVLVYSLKSGCWRRVGDLGYFVRFRRMSDVFVNGGLHFVVSSKGLGVGGDESVGSDCIVVAFDVCDYGWKCVSSFGVGGRKYEIELGVLGGCLSVIRNYEFGRSECMVMKEYGVNSSWSPLFRVEMDGSCRFRFRPVSYLGAEKLVLLEAKGRMFCFDVKLKSFKVFEIDGINQGFEFFVCMESEVVLGSVDGNCYDKVKQANGEKLEEVVNEMNLESEAVLSSVDTNDKIHQVKEELKEENLGPETVLGSVDGDECGKIQRVNEEVKEENIERVSAERDLGAT